jgi:hypothetical protein
MGENESPPPPHIILVSRTQFELNELTSVNVTATLGNQHCFWVFLDEVLMAFEPRTEKVMEGSRNFHSEEIHNLHSSSLLLVAINFHPTLSFMNTRQSAFR